MQIPNEIIICGHKVVVEKVTPKTNNGYGNYNDWFGRIQIQIEDRNEDMQAEVLLHEIMEAIKAKFGLKVEHNELTVFSEMVFAVIRENGLDFRKEEKKEKEVRCSTPRCNK